MGDLISRKALLEAMEKKFDIAMEKAFYSVGLSEGLIVVEGIINEQPTVEPPKGEWISLEPEIGLFECSECGHRILRAECKFCPNCGCDMRSSAK